MNHSESEFFSLLGEMTYEPTDKSHQIGQRQKPLFQFLSLLRKLAVRYESQRQGHPLGECGPVLGCVYEHIQDRK